MKRDGSGYQKLLRWYPREWRKRYGEEFLAMVEDTLEGRRPTLELRMGVARSGLRERARGRARSCRRTAGALLRVTFSPRISRWWAFYLTGWVLASLPAEFGVSLPAATAGRATAVLDTEAAIAALLAAIVLARCAIALPAFGRFIRAGGWPQIRRQVACAAGVTATAAGALAGLILVPSPMTFAQWNQSLTYLPGVLVTAVLIAVAIRLWSRAAAAAAGHLDLPPKAQTGERVLTAAAGNAVSLMMGFLIIWLAAVQSSAPMLIFGLSSVALQGIAGTGQIRGAVHPGRHRRVHG